MRWQKRARRPAVQEESACYPPHRGGDAIKLALLFPGNGSQFVGMGRDLARDYLSASQVLARADATFGGGLERLMFEGPIEELTRTSNAQPAILTASIMALTVLREQFPKLQPAYAAGHSLGEFSALVAAGPLDLETAVPLVRTRGSVMLEAVPEGIGTMTACIAGPTESRALCEAVTAEETHGILEVANYNGPAQTVVSGHTAANERARAIAAEHGIKRALPVPVSTPFHCSLMRPAAEAFAPHLKRLDLAHAAPYAFPVVTNLEATANTDPTRLDNLLTQQIVSPVRWTETIDFLLSAGVTHFIECGPGKILTNIGERGWKDAGATWQTLDDLLVRSPL